jgi:MFS family permease
MAKITKESGLTFVQKIQFFIASGGRSIISGLVNSAFVKYYTDFLGLDPKYMGWVWLAFTVWAAINDPIFGLWLDKRPYKKGIGKYRPFFIGSIPALVSCDDRLSMGKPKLVTVGDLAVFVPCTLLMGICWHHVRNHLWGDLCELVLDHQRTCAGGSDR